LLEGRLKLGASDFSGRVECLSKDRFGPERHGRRPVGHLRKVRASVGIGIHVVVLSVLWEEEREDIAKAICCSCPGNVCERLHSHRGSKRVSRLLILLLHRLDL